MKLRVFFGAMMLASMTLSLTAQTPKSNVEKVDNSALPSVFQKHSEAQRLANQGQREKSAKLLLQAAIIILDNPYESVETKKESKQNEPDAKPAQKGQRDNHTSIADLDVPQLLEEAKKYAQNDATLLAEIGKVEKAAREPRFGGTLNGPYRHYDQVGSYSSDWYAYTFRGGERAVIALSGDGDSDLDLYVYDENGNLVASDADSSDDCYVSWYPRWTGRFRVKVQNRGSVYNNYVIATN